MFVKKDGFFRPAGGDMSFQFRDRVTPVSYACLHSEDLITLRDNLDGN